VGTLFGNLMGMAIKQEIKFNSIDFFIPIPIRRSKMNQRGFNQSHVIAQGIQAMLNRPILHTVLQKNKRPFAQTNKDRIARLTKTNNPFDLKNWGQIQGKNILIIDDVCTTGATLQAAVACLTEGAPASISIATAAYTL
jgi:ComF family protein